MPLTAEDAAFSLQRAVKLNKTPGFILTQFGWNADNVEKLIRATGEYTMELTLPTLQATSFVLYCLSGDHRRRSREGARAGQPGQQRPRQCLAEDAQRGVRQLSPGRVAGERSHHPGGESACRW